MRPLVVSNRRKAQTRSREGSSREFARCRVISRSSGESAFRRIGFAQALGQVARRSAHEIAWIDEPVADLVERKAEEATRPERRQHDLRAFLGAVGLGHRIGGAHARIEGSAGAISGAGP
jgi:hypothetical protein